MGKRGFTLIELVVVVAILSFLMAFSMPMLRQSREQAKSSICYSNIRQLLTVLCAYENENNSFPYGFNDDRSLPKPHGGYTGYMQSTPPGWWWFNYVGSLYDEVDKSTTILRCPSSRLTNHELQTSLVCGNYGINQSICKNLHCINGNGREEFKGNPLSSGEVKHPGNTLLVLDSGYALINWWHATEQPPYPLGTSFIQDTSYVPGLKINAEREFRPGQETDAILGRHPRKKVNIGFVDSHAERRKADDLLVEELDGRYKNRSPLWSPK